MFSSATKAAIFGAIRRSLSKGPAWSVYQPVEVDTDYGTESALGSFDPIAIRFKRLNAADKVGTFAMETRPMYRITSTNFAFLVDQIIKVEDDDSYGSFKVVDVTPPVPNSVPTAHFATVVQLS